MKNTPHQHAELIKVWADGAVIQYFNQGSSKWVDEHYQPEWCPNMKYRIKPEPKSDAELLWIAFGGTSEGFHDTRCEQAKSRYCEAIETFNRLKQEQENAS